VDVNVHPAKKEVRFLNESRIYWAISQAVKNALRKVADAPALDLAGPESRSGAGFGPGFGNPFDQGGILRESGEPPESRKTGFAEGARDGEPEDSAGSQDPASGRSAPGTQDAPAPFTYAAFAPAGKGPDVTNALPPLPGRGDDQAASNQIRLFPAETRTVPVPVSRFRPDEPSAVMRPRSPEVPYLQLHNGFILFGVESGLMMVNQQAAHERVMYEKAMEELRQPGRLSSQQLLFPEVLEFAPGDSLFLEEHLDRLRALGFDLESFGGNAFQLRGLPMEVKPDQARRVVYELVEGLVRPERGAQPARGEDFQQRLAKVYSRVTSVKLGERLEYPQVSALIDGLFATQNPYVSPSGLPIVVRFSLEEIHRKFGLKP
jgi:DNA mismatch repair protein MutL